MSKKYTKEIITKKISTFIRCDKCKRELCLDYIFDIPIYVVVDKENYCTTCQKKYKVGWYKPKIK